MFPPKNDVIVVHCVCIRKASPYVTFLLSKYSWYACFILISDYYLFRYLLSGRFGVKFLGKLSVY